MSETWILDRLLRAGGLDVLWPDVMGTHLEMGFNHADLTQAMSGVGSLAQMPQAWLRAGARHEARARAEEEAGHAVTAAETWFRALGCFGRARWGMFSDTDEKARLYDRLNGAYDRVIELSRARIERVEVPVGDASVPGLLHLPAGTGPEAPVPAVVLFPGMDMIKEYLPVPHRNVFTDRGLAVLALDPPGHGFANIQGIKMGARNVEEAGSASIDLLRGRPEVDADAIGVFGISLGSYFAASLAAEDDRPAAVVSFEGGVFYDKVRFAEESQPTFKSRLAYMTGTETDADLHRVLRELTMAGRESSIRAPYLLVTGEWDELTPVADCERMVDGVGDRARLVVYEGENHVMGNVIHEALRRGVDFLADHLNKRPSSEVQPRVLVPAAR